MKKSLKVEMWIIYTLTTLRVVYGICGDTHTVYWIPQWTRGTGKFRLGTPMGVFQITYRETQDHKHIVFHHFLSHVICSGSSDDGVQWPLGEAFTWSVVDEGYHDNWLVHPRWGQLHQLTDIQINITGMNLCMCSTKQFVDYLWTRLLCLFEKCRKAGKSCLNNRKHWTMVHFLCPVAAKGRPFGCNLQQGVLGYKGAQQLFYCTTIF